MTIIRNLLSKKKHKTGLVFIVEDDAVYAKTLEGYLKLNVPTVKEVMTFQVGETCIVELKRNPDLIIMDYYLNSIFEDAQTGLETIYEIRTISPEVPIVVLSSQNDIEVALEVVEKQKCQYFVKDEKSFEKIRELFLSI